MFSQELQSLQSVNPRWLFMSVVGSHNYGTATPDSDVDVKIAYLPTFEEFYRNKFQHTDTGSPHGNDYTLHPAHEFLRHAFKGNMNFWEVLFAPSLEINSEFWNGSGEMRMFFSHCRDIVTMNPMHNFNAMRGMAIQKNKEANACWARSLDIENQAKMWKAAQHAMRMLETLIEYHRCGELVLDLTNPIRFMTPNEWEVWRTTDPSELNFPAYSILFHNTLKIVDNLEDSFKECNNNIDVRSDRERYMATIDDIMMKLVLEDS